MKAKLATFGALFLLLSFAYSIATTQVDIYKEKQRQAAIEERKAQLARENDELMRILSDGGEKYMERAAREKGYVKPGERVFED